MNCLVQEKSIVVGGCLHLPDCYALSTVNDNNEGLTAGAFQHTRTSLQRLCWTWPPVCW